jgi:hypothetical protein
MGHRDAHGHRPGPRRQGRVVADPRRRGPRIDRGVGVRCLQPVPVERLRLGDGEAGRPAPAPAAAPSAGSGPWPRAGPCQSRRTPRSGSCVSLTVRDRVHRGVGHRRDEGPARGPQPSLRRPIEGEDAVMIDPVVLQALVPDPIPRRREAPAVVRPVGRGPLLADDPDVAGPGRGGPGQLDLAAAGLDPDVGHVGEDQDRAGRGAGRGIDVVTAAEDGVADRLARRHAGIVAGGGGRLRHQLAVGRVRRDPAALADGPEGHRAEAVGRRGRPGEPDAPAPDLGLEVGRRVGGAGAQAVAGLGQVGGQRQALAVEAPGGRRVGLRRRTGARGQGHGVAAGRGSPPPGPTAAPGPSGRPSAPRRRGPSGRRPGAGAAARARRPPGPARSRRASA